MNKIPLTPLECAALHVQIKQIEFCLTTIKSSHSCISCFSESTPKLLRELQSSKLYLEAHLENLYNLFNAQ